MADTLKSSQIIQQQIDNLKSAAPPPLTKDERDQIMKGRKGQKDIDAGRAAIEARAKEISDHTRALNDLFDKLGKANEGEVVQTNKEGDEARRLEREKNADPMWNTYIPSAIGATAGAGIGEIENRILHGFSKGNADAVKGIANELGPIENLTNSQLNRARMAGAGAAADKYAPSSLSGKAGAVLGRGLSYGIPAGLFYNEYNKYHDRATDPNATDADKSANQRIANGLLGVSTGIAADGGMRFFFPSRHEGEGEALTRINAARDYTRRMDTADANRANQPPETPPASPTRPLTAREALVEQARVAGIKNVGKKNMGELTRILEAMNQGGKKLPGLAGPLTAGAVAYAMTPDRAEAADGSSVGGQSEALTNAAVVGGGTYGAGKIIEAVPKVIGRAAGAGLSMANPGMMATIMDDEGPDAEADRNMARNTLARYAPAVSRMLPGAPRQALEMAQVPERNTGKMDEYAMARSLQIPEGIPAPNPDGSSPYPDLVSAMSNGQRAAVAPPPPMLSRQLIEAMMQGR